MIEPGLDWVLSQNVLPLLELVRRARPDASLDFWQSIIARSAEAYGLLDAQVQRENEG